jgi:hypothetical protein
VSGRATWLLVHADQAAAASKGGVPLVVTLVDPNLIGSGAESGPLVERIQDPFVRPLEGAHEQ